MKKKSLSVKFDPDTAVNMANSFAVSTGLHCSLYSSNGQCIHERGEAQADCSFCKKLCAATGQKPGCDKLHSYGAFQSERFGGRYIYSCPMGMAFTASPIIIGGSFAGALIGGPVLIVSMEDFLASDTMHLSQLDPTAAEDIRNSLLNVPRRSPRQLDHISRQLFADAVYVGDSSHELFMSRSDNAQQNFIGDYISQLKQRGEALQYPLSKEQELSSAISRGERATANTLLNEILGYIFFYISDPNEIRTRVSELLVVLSRAAAYGGANTEQILRISHQYMQDMRLLNSQEELTRWLASSLNRFTELVFTMLDSKHSNAILSAVDYMKEEYMRAVTLEDVAEYVGYSPSYFSRIFKEELGSSFKEYLNELRIERSKVLLLSSGDSVAQIGHLVGFSDQSYFCKTFRRFTGTTPDKFRKRVRRIDTGREYGLK